MKISRFGIRSLLAKNAIMYHENDQPYGTLQHVFVSIMQSVLCKSRYSTVLLIWHLTTISDMCQEMVAKTLQVWNHAYGNWLLIWRCHFSLLQHTFPYCLYQALPNSVLVTTVLLSWIHASWGTMHRYASWNSACCCDISIWNVFGYFS